MEEAFGSSGVRLSSVALKVATDPGHVPYAIGSHSPDYTLPLTQTEEKSLQCSCALHHPLPLLCTFSLTAQGLPLQHHLTSRVALHLLTGANRASFQSGAHC